MVCQGVYWITSTNNTNMQTKISKKADSLKVPQNQTYLPYIPQILGLWDLHSIPSIVVGLQFLNSSQAAVAASPSVTAFVHHHHHLLPRKDWLLVVAAQIVVVAGVRRSENFALADFH